MTDFQKAQCFFMIAINIAALVNKYQGDLQPQTIQQIYNNNILIKSLSISGYLPVSVTLLGLHMVGMVSWFLLILSLLTAMISFATFVSVGTFSLNRTDLSTLASVAQANQQANSSCGGNNLTVYCLDTQGDLGGYDPSNGADFILGLCTLSLIFLLADRCHAFLDPSTKVIRPWLLKVYKKCVVDCFSLRVSEIILVSSSSVGKSWRYP